MLASDSASQPNSPATFSPLELRVIRLAASTRERARPRGTSAFDRLFGLRPARSLADPRLEALRRHAVAVRSGAAEADPAFTAAGYSAAHTAKIGEIIRAVARRQTPAARRDRAAYLGGIGFGLSGIVGFIGLTVGMLVR